MKINFFASKYVVEPVHKEEKFYLYDAGNNKPTYISFDDKYYQAIVFNKEKKFVQFVAIDNNIKIYKNNSKDEESLCDCLLFTKEDFILFIELKDQQKQWLSNSLSQLKNTIRLFKENHTVEIFDKRRAYASNKQHPHFAHSYKETMQRFRQETGFILRIQDTITI